MMSSFVRESSGKRLTSCSNAHISSASHGEVKLVWVGTGADPTERKNCDTSRTILLAAVLLADSDASTRDIRSVCQTHTTQIQAHAGTDRTSRPHRQGVTYITTHLGFGLFPQQWERDPELVGTKVSTF